MENNGDRGELDLIKRIDITNPKIAIEVLNVQKISYMVEAELN